MGIFDSKTFNSEVFGKYVETVSDLKRNELIKSGVFNLRNDLKSATSEQTGANYFVDVKKAPIGGSAVNYDGSTNISANARKTYSVGKPIIGRANAWVEKDFSYDVTGGNNFLPVANEIAHYFDGIDQATLLAELAGIFSMTGGKNADFVTKHTLDISGEASANVVDATTLNKAIVKACGDNKNAFSIAIMHSAVAGNLENLNLINYLKYTDKKGIQRDLGLGTWNGKLVLVDDSMPTATAGSSATYTTYTTYLLGKGAFDYCDCGCLVPYEMERDALTSGGTTTLVARQRKMISPAYISFKGASIISPTDTQLSTGANWELANDGHSSSKTYVDDKAITIARIISRG